MLTVAPPLSSHRTTRTCSSCSHQNSVQPTIHVHIPDSSAKLIPDKKERDLWWAFLAGRPESEWNPPKKPKQPKVSRWQQRNLRQASHEETTLPYDMNETRHDSTDVAAPPAPPSVVYPIQVPSDAPPLKEEPLPSPVFCSPREPTPALLQHIDHVRLDAAAVRVQLDVLPSDMLSIF